MENANKRFLAMSHGITLSRNQCPKTVDERVQMSGVPHASTIGSIMYAMICIRGYIS